MGSAAEQERKKTAGLMAIQSKALPSSTAEVESQVESVQYTDEGTGIKWTVVDGEVYLDEPTGWRQAAYMILSLQWRIDVTSKRKWVYWRPNSRIKKIKTIGK